MNFMNYQFTSDQLLWGGIILAIVLIIAVAGYLEFRRNRTAALRTRFGSEYDRAVRQSGSSGQAEAKLAGRTSRVQTLVIRDLGAPEHDRFVTEWYALQSRFVDHPKSSVTDADDLINALLEARGYPQVPFEQRAADLSVTYPRVMENYRLAHDVAVRLGRADASTEELRTAMIQYRAVFDEIVQPQKAQQAVAAS